MSASQWVYGYVLILLDRYFDGVELPASHVQLAYRSGLFSELRLLLCQLRSFISYSNEDMDMFSSSLQSRCYLVRTSALQIRDVLHCVSTFQAIR